MSDFTKRKISDTYQRLLQLSSSGKIADGTGSLVSISELRFSDGTTQITAGGSGGATGGGVFVNKGGGTFELTESVSTLKIGAPLLPSDDKNVTIGSQTAPFKEVFVDSGSLIVVSGSATSSIQFLDNNLQFDSNVSASVVGELIGTSSFSTTAASAESSSFSTIASAGGGGAGGCSLTGLDGGSGGGGGSSPGATSAGGSGNTPPVSPPQLILKEQDHLKYLLHY